ncbi:phosphatase PAP2 family protein [Zobellia barbeyronii]|uniref:Phosphatase PAP2 family protein n=1 Tax=Zobellia barbeyronii TaxID=2748009 RepID=A0ABS5WCZ5_9FLAO|nr:phosphatase PAP2 family protein [Zobellia barbeyronii]MBT2161273.1 phosphatase PAP2 family protein [Zobellia barbeyronii]
MSKSLLVPIFLILYSLGFSQTIQDSLQDEQYFDISKGLSYGYAKPKFFDMLKYIPKDIADFGKFAVQKENLIWTGSAIGTTAAIMPFDQQLTDESIKFGSNFAFDKGHSYSSIGPFRVIPNNINSAVYYIGNGGTTILLSGMFYAIGAIGEDYRALNTSSELVEVLLSMGIITQTIKRITGRQSPGPAIASGNPGGHWTFLPSLKEYQTRTGNYDAMPSGHVATFMATITVIATNYPEIKWIKPVGYTLMGVMAFEMMSSRVHWASDYPLALLIGYVVGKAAADRRIKKIDINETGKRVSNKIKTDFNLGQLGSYQTFGVSFTF